MNANKPPNLFDEFEVANGAGFEITYGLPVVEIEATVKAMIENGTTVADLVARFKTQLGLPENTIVFVDGNLFAASTTIPADAKRIEIVKAAGAKGAATLAATPTIPLKDEDAAIIVIAAEDTVNYICRQPVEEGKISVSLESRLSGMFVVLSRGPKFLTVGHHYDKILASRKVLRQITIMKRRVQGGIAKNDSLLVTEVTEHLYPLRILWNDDFIGKELIFLRPGDRLTIVVRGMSLTEDYTKISDFAAKLAEMNWFTLRALGLRYGLKVAGKGRTMQVIAWEILKVEFPEIPDDERLFGFFK